jgi:TPR repeat protein
VKSDSRERPWEDVSAALDAGASERAIAVLKVLADEGDWRASTSIAAIYESKGKASASNHAIAAHWYERSLSQEEQPFGHLGLARYHFFGMGSGPDYARAFEHLTHVPIEHDDAVALMLGEMYFLGLGTPKIPAKARSMFEVLAARGLPLGLLHLGRMERLEGRSIRG